MKGDNLGGIKKKIEKETGLSSKKIQRAKIIHKKASEKAKKTGKKKADLADYREAVNSLNTERRSKQTARILPDKRTGSHASENKQIVLQDAGLLNSLKNADLKKFQNKTLLLYRSAKPQERNNFKATLKDLLTEFSRIDKEPK